MIPINPSPSIECEWALIVADSILHHSDISELATRQSLDLKEPKSETIVERGRGRTRIRRVRFIVLEGVGRTLVDHS